MREDPQSLTPKPGQIEGDHFGVDCIELDHISRGEFNKNKRKSIITIVYNI